MLPGQTGSGRPNGDDPHCDACSSSVSALRRTRSRGRHRQRRHRSHRRALSSRQHRYQRRLVRTNSWYFSDTAQSHFTARQRPEMGRTRCRSCSSSGATALSRPPRNPPKPPNHQRRTAVTAAFSGTPPAPPEQPRPLSTVSKSTNGVRDRDAQSAARLVSAQRVGRLVGKAARRRTRSGPRPQ